MATIRLDYEYEIEYEYVFSNQIRVPTTITNHNNLIPYAYLCVSQQQERVIVRGIQNHTIVSKFQSRTRSRTPSQI